MLTEEFELNRPKAEVVNGGLVLSFPNAVNPIVWRHSLDKMDDVSFQLLFEGNICILAIKTTTGHLKEVARFASRDEGKYAMQLATDALFAGGRFLSGSDKTGKSSILGFANILVFLLLAAVIFGGLRFYGFTFSRDGSADVLLAEQAVLPDRAVPVISAPAPEVKNVIPGPKDKLNSGNPVDADELFSK